MNKSQFVILNVTDYARPTAAVVDTASQVADAARLLLKDGKSVIVSLKGVKGVSSSFFNVLLAAVIPELGGIWRDDRFSVELDNNSQQVVFDRSKKAALGQ